MSDENRDAVVENASARGSLDVFITDVRLCDGPASITTSVRVGQQEFWSEIVYHSICSWESVRRRMSNDGFLALISAIVAWDSMRFLNLGGTRLICAAKFPLEFSAETREVWRYCFKNQYSEIRFRNNFRYADEMGPMIAGGEEYEATPEDHVLEKASANGPRRMLLANGGGKDTLASIIILNKLGAHFDTYEGYLPLGGSVVTQKKLLERLSSYGKEVIGESICVTIRDNFFDCPEQDFIDNGAMYENVKGDFMVGHTANYVGYFPLIIAGEYESVLFNIEKSADWPQIHWNGEPINHQWCKSTDYRKVCSDLFRNLTGLTYFSGFDSPLAGLHDFGIYKIIANSPAGLLSTHSCNVRKPWCRQCPKCLFCYLMMSAFFDIEFANEVTGSDISLFDDENLSGVWDGLLNEATPTWECVPGKEECLLAVSMLWFDGCRNAIVEKYRLPDSSYAIAQGKFGVFDEEGTPELFRKPVSELLCSGNSKFQATRSSIKLGVQLGASSGPGT